MKISLPMRTTPLAAVTGRNGSSFTNEIPAHHVVLHRFRRKRADALCERRDVPGSAAGHFRPGHTDDAADGGTHAALPRPGLRRALPLPLRPAAPPPPPPPR